MLATLRAAWREPHVGHVFNMPGFTEPGLTRELAFARDAECATHPATRERVLLDRHRCPTRRRRPENCGHVDNVVADYRAADRLASSLSETSP